MSEPLTEEARRELFSALVNSQDQGSSVENSRQTIAERFRVDVESVRGIEQEGISKKWPPLDAPSAEN